MRPTAVTGTGSGSSRGSGSGSEKDRSSRKGSRSHHSKRDRDREGRSRPSNLGMTSSVSEGSGLSGGEAGDAGIPTSLTLPIVTASGTDVTTLSGSTTPIAEAESSSAAAAAATAAAAGAKKTGMAKLDGPGVADDASVLPVPNHVVLHHLSTSAIRNGVLAVANTTRYRKKVVESHFAYNCEGRWLTDPLFFNSSLRTVHHDDLLQTDMTFSFHLGPPVHLSH